MARAKGQILENMNQSEEQQSQGDAMSNFEQSLN